MRYCDKLLVTLILGAAVSWGQEIDISGVVQDSAGGVPVAGAEVRLAARGLKTTTDAAGVFHLSGAQTVLWEQAVPAAASAPIVVNRAGIVTVSLAESEDVTVSTYSLQGKLVNRIRESMQAGRHTVELPRFATGLHIHRITIRGAAYTHTTPGQAKPVGGRPHAGSDALKKIAQTGFGDTIVVEYNGARVARVFTAQPTQHNVVIKAALPLVPPHPSPCTPPISPYPVNNPTTVVGNGTPASCTESALRDAVSKRGVITFNCGPNPVTITLTQQLDVSGNSDVIIDGGGRVTLDGGKRVRHFHYHAGWWMSGNVKLVLQRLTLRNGRAPLGEYFPQNPSAPKCAYGYKEGSGGSVFIRDGVLHVIECAFYDNEAALVGPDVGGGAIYALGCREVIVSGSRFEGNRAANGGAIAMLYANPKIYNTVFINNTAEGVGMNYVEAGCPGLGHKDQGGAGGLGGGVYFDGMNSDGVVYTLCGSTFINNRCNELGGALFRTPNEAMREMMIDRCAFIGNTAKMGAVSFIKQNKVTVRASLFANNIAGRNVKGETIAGNLGGLWVNTGSVDIVNSTFYRNVPGGLDVEGSASTVKNCTFVENRIAGPFTVNNSLFSNVSCGTTPFGGANNLQWPSGNACAGGTTFADPKLGELAHNGGPTMTCLPAAGSSVLAIGANCPETDQRGFVRSSSRCCVGAVDVP